MYRRRADNQSEGGISGSVAHDLSCVHPSIQPSIHHMDCRVANWLFVNNCIQRHLLLQNIQTGIAVVQTIGDPQQGVDGISGSVAHPVRWPLREHNTIVGGRRFNAILLYIWVRDDSYSSPGAPAPRLGGTHATASRHWLSQPLLVEVSELFQDITHPRNWTVAILSLTFCNFSPHKGSMI